MKLSWFMAVIAAASLALSPAAAAVTGQTDKEVEVIAGPILDTMLNGLNDGNYGLYSKYFDDTLKDAIPEKKFKEVREDIQNKFGRYQSRTYLGALKQGNFSTVLWKGRFSKNDNDVLIKLVLSKRGDKVQVTGLWFQ